MKKLILAAALFIGGISAANAQGYNRVAVSYDHTNLSPNKEMGDKTVGLNGFGLNYTHGFGIAENMFVEAGGNVDFLFGSKDKMKYQNINLQVPVNYVYRFNITEGVSIDPYLGVNFKLHFTEKEKYDVDGAKWADLFSKDDMGNDGTWNRFQMGWQVGVGLNYERYYLGVQFGTDFIPAFSQDKAKVNTNNIKVSLGYSF